MLSIIIDLAYNLAPLVALSVISGFNRQDREPKVWGFIFQGMLFGGASVIGMMRPLPFVPGLVFDGQSLLISLCGLFFGPLAVSIAGGMSAIYEIFLGGVGVYMGVLAIASSALLGLVFHHRWLHGGVPLTARRLLWFGLLVQVAVLLLMFTLPMGPPLGVMTRIGLPILLVCPLGTLLIGKVLSAQEVRNPSMQAQLEREAQNRALISAIPDIIFTNSQNGEFLAVHAPDPRVLFLPQETFLHRTVEEVLPKPLADQFMKAHAEALTSTTVQVLNYTLLIGVEERHFEARVTPCSEDTVITLVRDVTEQKKAAESLRESQEKYQTLFDSAGDAIFIHDAEARVLAVNPMACERLGYTYAELMSMTVNQVDSAEETLSAQNRIARVMEQGYLTFETVHRRKDGTLIPTDVNARRIVWEGRPAIMGICRDITERKHTEERQRQLQGDPKNHLHALGELVDHSFLDATQLFQHGLALLVQQLGVERAVMSRHTELGWEVFWRATAEGVEAELTTHEPAHDFCSRVLEHPGRTLMIRDVAKDPAWQGLRATQPFSAKAYLGASLNQSGRITGVLSVTSGRPKAFTRAEIAMVKALANLFGKTLEVEQLKHELQVTRDALDLTAAVVEDSALEAPVSRLPNLHYLDIWLKANLFLARRRGEAMAVVRWGMPLTLEAKKGLMEVSEALRGEDLLVDLGQEQLLLLLPHTPQEGAQILLDRIRLRLGPIPMGATLWNPTHKADRDDFVLRNATHRAVLGLQRSQETAQERGPMPIWNLPLLRPEDLADTTNYG